MKKYDIVEVCNVPDEFKDKYKEVFIGKVAMVINVDKRTYDYQIELCFFDLDTQLYAKEEGFDYWDEGDLDWY